MRGSMASIKVTYSVALHCPYTLGKEISLILSCLTPRCNMQWPNGKSVLEILLSYLTPGHTECGGLSSFFEVPACNKPSALDGLQFSSFEVSLFFGNIVSTLATLMVPPCQQREKYTRPHRHLHICGLRLHSDSELFFPYG